MIPDAVEELKQQQISWKLYFSPEGYPYYYNHESGESRWSDTGIKSITDTQSELNIKSNEVTEIDVENKLNEEEFGDTSDDADSDELDSGYNYSETEEGESVDEEEFADFLDTDTAQNDFDRMRSIIDKKLMGDSGSYSFFINKFVNLFSKSVPETHDELNSYTDDITALITCSDDDDLSLSSEDSDVREMKSPILPPIIILSKQFLFLPFNVVIWFVGLVKYFLRGLYSQDFSKKRPVTAAYNDEDYDRLSLVD